MFIYIKTESALYTVGFYKPSGDFYPLKDFNEVIQAITLVNFLNGGSQDVTLIRELMEL